MQNHMCKFLCTHLQKGFLCAYTFIAQRHTLLHLHAAHYWGVGGNNAESQASVSEIL